MLDTLSEAQQRELRAVALDTYRKTRIGRPHMPHEDTPEGQRKLERLFDIMRVALQEDQSNAE